MIYQLMQSQTAIKFLWIILNSFFGSRDRRGAVHGAFEGGAISSAAVGEGETEGEGAAHGAFKGGAAASGAGTGEGTGDQVISDVCTLAAHGAFEGGSASGAGTGDQTNCGGCTFMKSFWPRLQWWAAPEMYHLLP